MDPFGKFIDSCGSNFSSVHIPFESTTFAVDIIEEFIDAQKYPFSSVHITYGSNIDCCKQYPQPSSILQTHGTSLLYNMVDDY